MVRGVIFDLDGVLVTTDEYHFRSWQRITAEEGIPFDRATNERLRGISRMASLEIVLERAPRRYSDDEKRALAERKNNLYRELLANLGEADLLPGVRTALSVLRERGIKLAVASSSKNTAMILERTELRAFFDAVADGNEIENSKPDPEVFLLAARRLGLTPGECLVIEDARSGVEAARRAGMRVVGIGQPGALPGADFVVADLSHVSIEKLLGWK